MTFHCEYAWLGGAGVAEQVLIDVADGRITRVTDNTPAPPGAHRLPGLTVPGLANTHSHVFHRAIRGRSQSGVTDFWRWRDVMYDAAGHLDPDRMYALARATYAEMALSGITAVGEFHYVHHNPDGTPYDDPNAMGHALARAAADAGIRLTLLDTCYLMADIDGRRLEGVQRRFSDGSAEDWARRTGALRDGDRLRIGAAVHSVRAVPREAMTFVAADARRRGVPLHVHLSEQPAENAACRQRYGRTPTRLLHEKGVLGEGATAVHATHLDSADIALLGGSGTGVCLCPTTERDLADGIGPAGRLAAAGTPLSLGSDAHMMIDLWEEARAIELDERLISGRRGHWTAAELLTAATSAGMAALGWNAGAIAAGRLADLATVRLDSPRTAGARAGDPLAHTVFAGTAADVSHVVTGGELVVENGRHRHIEDVGGALDKAITTLLAD
ncbi:formimidoylglutamate deiminase [Streptomyces sp. NPDC000151]|uniref:formimidoylglutamate deiminase n=1 Tax=Streptomyces sp. NPDC000151 TaxID=3154244 RepID=UPI003323C966